MNRFPSLFRILTTSVLLLGLVAATGLSASTPPPPEATIKMTPKGNQLAFAKTQFSVQPGQTVTIVFENTATSPAMRHNVVVLNTADASAVKRVGQAAVSASNYVPDDSAIIAATDVAKPGETTTVTFTAPETPGQYTYVCTFPGHYSQMQGTMTVKEDGA